MKNIKTYGKIEFDPKDLTKKHKNQSSWKKIALVRINDELCDYYAWFIKKRYNLILNTPIRKSHISFINDSLNDMKNGLNCSEQEIDTIWASVKNKWEGKEIEVVLDVDVRTDGTHWWLNIVKKQELLYIRSELGLSKPFWGLHMTIGYANEKNLAHSEYILSGIRKGLIL